FYTAAGGPPVPATVATASKAASVARAHWSLGRAGLLLARPPTESLDVEPVIEAALADARAQGVSGQAVTPFVLAHIHRETARAQPVGVRRERLDPLRGQVGQRDVRRHRSSSVGATSLHAPAGRNRGARRRGRAAGRSRGRRGTPTRAAPRYRRTGG